MPTFCTIVVALVSCTIDPATRSTPADAAAILAASRPPVVAPSPRFLLADGWPSFDPRIGPIDADGPFRWPVPRAPARRLDGTRLSDPVTVYGAPDRFRGRGPGAWRPRAPAEPRGRHR